MGASTVSELLDFTGGMNTLISPHLIDKREARNLVNVDIRLGSLQSMPNLDLVGNLPNGPYFYEYLSKVYSYDTYRSNVLWDGKWYWSDGIDTGKMLENGTEYPLGIDAPTTPLTLTISTGGGLTHTGDFKYTYTFYSTLTGTESPPAPLPPYITADNEDIVVDGFEPLPPEADRYRLYRIGGYLPLFSLVDTLETTDIPFLDNIDDTRIDGRSLTSLRTGTPPDRLENLIELNGRVYGSVGTKLYFSALGNPDAWYISDYFIMQDTIIALGKSPAGLLVLGRFYTSLLVGSDATNFRLKVMSDQLGCIGKESVSHLADSAIWLSHKSFCMANGYNIVDITANKLDRLSGMSPTGACVENETYYMSFRPSLFPSAILFPSTTLYPGGTAGAGGLDQGMVALDFKRGKNFSYKLIDYLNIRYVDIVRGNVNVSTGALDANLVPCDDILFPECLDTIQCSPFELNIMNLYQGQGLTELHYTSPELIDGSRATLKEYDKVRILFKGIFNIKVVFDNLVVAVEQNIQTLTDNEEGNVIIGIPNANNKSYSIQFVIEGVGTIESIQYSWKPREVIN